MYIEANLINSLYFSTIEEAIMAIDQTKFQKGVSVDGFDGRITKDREIK